MRTVLSSLFLFFTFFLFWGLCVSSVLGFNEFLNWTWSADETLVRAFVCNQKKLSTGT